MSTFNFTDTKDPEHDEDFGIDWSDTLDESTPADTLTASTWTADAGVTVDSDTNTTTGTTVWVSGGARGAVCNLVNSVETAAGRKYQGLIELTLSDKAED